MWTHFPLTKGITVKGIQSMFFFFFFFTKRVCPSKDTAQQNGREQRKKGVEGVEQEESTPKPVAAGIEKYVYFSNLPVLKEGS